MAGRAPKRPGSIWVEAATCESVGVAICEDVGEVVGVISFKLAAKPEFGRCECAAADVAGLDDQGEVKDRDGSYGARMCGECETGRLSWRLRRQASVGGAGEAAMLAG